MLLKWTQKSLNEWIVKLIIYGAFYFQDVQEALIFENRHTEYTMEVSKTIICFVFGELNGILGPETDWFYLIYLSGSSREVGATTNCYR